MQHNKNVGEERQTIASLPLFVRVLFVWLLKFTNGLLRGGEIYLLRHNENLPYLPLKLCSVVMNLHHWPSVISNLPPPLSFFSNELQARTSVFICHVFGLSIYRFQSHVTVRLFEATPDFDVLLHFIEH